MAGNCHWWIVGNYGRGPSVSLLLLSSRLGGIMVLPVDCWKLRPWSVRFAAVVVVMFGWDHGAARGLLEITAVVRPF
jgi:hypothetical protein